MKVFDLLPRELFVEISNHLSLDDFLSLCLVNKYMFATLRTSSNSFQYFSCIPAYTKEYPSISDSINKFIASKTPKRLIIICMPWCEAVFQILLISRKENVEFKWRWIHNDGSLIQAEKFLLDNYNGFSDDAILSSTTGSALDDYYAPVLVYPTGPDTSIVRESDVHIQLEILAFTNKKTSIINNIRKKWRWGKKLFSILPFSSYFKRLFRTFDASSSDLENTSSKLRSKSSIWSMEVIKTVEICKEGNVVFVAKGRSDDGNTCELDDVLRMVLANYYFLPNEYHLEIIYSAH